MGETLEIRESVPGDIPALRELYPAAFPDEDLLLVLSELLDDQPWGLSLVALSDGAIAGHIYFTICTVDGRTERVAMLAPLAVTPSLQRRGIGSALIREGIERMKNADVVQVCVLGDPAYYGRAGFTCEADIQPPYPLPEEWRSAWQSIRLRTAGEHLTGTLTVPAPWRRPELWSE